MEFGQGRRRQKLAGYFKAANELRQTYQQSYMQSWNTKDGSDDLGMPGAFPGAHSSSHGDDEMLLFPSYARRHVKRKPTSIPGTVQQAPAGGRDVRDTVGTGDAEFWQAEWDRYEDDNAVVDVDVRGWIYTPHRGPMTRKHRLYVGMARQVLGLPAPAGGSSSNSEDEGSGSPHGIQGRINSHAAKHEEEVAFREAESIVRRGEAEAQIAGEGGYSEVPDRDSRFSSRSNTPPARKDGDKFTRPVRSRPLSGYGDQPSPMHHQASWNDPSQMSASELKIANKHLLDRLRPFLANPLYSIAISAFFYNESNSRQRTIETDTSGHFTLRAALDFVPTHVRVLVSESLSATVPVQISEPAGISLISDIDDTIKHSAITSGAREIFRNVFIRDVNDLTIRGVTDWYRRLADMGVDFHYVSNSPWQVYPVLTTFFDASRLPQGSFHLRQYTGVFQGIFEPVAERKKAPLERILRDFPERRFILVGDSGEADLEVYTDIVQEHPGRILGIFIRDVTTNYSKVKFNSEMGPLSGESWKTRSQNTLRSQDSSSALNTANKAQEERDMREAIMRSLKDPQSSKDDGRSAEEERPALPRRPTAPAAPEEDLIDLTSDLTIFKSNDGRPGSKKLAPPRPTKPRSLSSAPNPESTTQTSDKTPPPIPSKPSTSIFANGNQNGSGSFDAHARESTSSKPLSYRKPAPAPPPPRNSARSKLASAYEQLPSASALVFGQNETSQSQSSTRGPSPQPPPPRSDTAERRPALPPRKPTNSSVASTSAFQDSSDRASVYSTNSAATTSTYSGGYYDSYGNQQTPVNKREEIWKRRWARAKDLLDRKGVMLRGWRVGEDVAEDVIRLVEQAQKR